MLYAKKRIKATIHRYGILLIISFSPDPIEVGLPSQQQAQILWLPICHLNANGLNEQEYGPSSSNLVALAKTATAKVSTLNSERKSSTGGLLLTTPELFTT